MAEADDTNSTRLFPEQSPDALIELRYPDALLPGGRLSLRWWLRLTPEGRVLELHSNASADSPEIFVGVAANALKNARFSPALLGLNALPGELCLELRFQETTEPGEHVQLRRLDAESGAAPCLGASAALAR